METSIDIWDSFEKNARTMFINNMKGINAEVEMTDLLLNEIFSLDYLDLAYRKESGKYNQFVSYTNLSITKLNFLKYFKNLKYLNLCGQPHLTDLSGLENCHHLIELNASYLSITNFASFKTLTSLKTLNLHCLNTDKKIRFTPLLIMDELSNLKLEKLNLTRCFFKDISFLNKIHSLKELSLFNTNIGSLNQLNNLHNLESLVVCCSDGFQFSSTLFPNLKKLFISNRQSKGIDEFKARNPNCEIIECISQDIFESNSRLDYYPESAFLKDHNARFGYLKKTCYEDTQRYPKVFTPYDFHNDSRSFQKLEIPIPRKAKVSLSKKGISEDYFKRYLFKYFSNQVSSDLEFVISDWLPKVPDFVLSDFDKKIFIDIEIDEPYSIVDGALFHHNGKDSDRNFTFIYNNWFVVRFTEEQVVRNPDECCQFIKQFRDYITARLNGDNVIWENNFSQFDEAWSVELLLKRQKDKYRESYISQLK